MPDVIIWDGNKFRQNKQTMIQLIKITPNCIFSDDNTTFGAQNFKTKNSGKNGLNTYSNCCKFQFEICLTLCNVDNAFSD